MAAIRTRCAAPPITARRTPGSEIETPPGALEDATLPTGRDDIQAELERVSIGSDVDKELALMKAQLPVSAAPPAVEGGGTRQTPPEQETTS
ncbi:hypothetical protein ACWGDT_23490 [Streptomyces avermitilis]